ncbi:hypothetical protein RDABS01_024457 [Bienertia sinuspersici]
MEELKQREERYWKQRSRQSWLMEGDKNTKFFHAKSMQLKARNQIKKVKNGAGVIHDDEDQITEVFTAYFESLFSNDPWVPNMPGFRVSNPHINDDGNPVFLKELINDGQWNETLVRSIFTADATDGILQIPIPMFEVEDEWEWSLSKHGEFIVRSACYAGLQENDRVRPATQVVENRTLWQSFWKIHAPPKGKFFGWKVLHRGISVKEKLRMRGMEVDVRCPMCGSYEESILHLLVRFSEAELIWRYSPLRLEFCFKDVGWWSLFWTIAWGIWLKRNMWVFSSKSNEMQYVIQRLSLL